jgi:hypothetical protein
MMCFRFFLMITLLLLCHTWSGEPIFKNPDLISAESSDDLAVDRISVRESTSELQVTVGERLFVFGKAKGTLDKVKVGMHVLPFSQIPDIQGNESTFSKVAWKKLKDGSLQVQASYDPWPATLTWTVFASGELKMEAASQTGDFSSNAWLGLGFSYPEYQLNQIFWKGNPALSSEDQGYWKNENYQPLGQSDPTDGQPHGVFFQQIQSMKLEFETVTLDVRTESPGIFFRMGKLENQDANYPEINSGLGFLFNLAENKAMVLEQESSAINQKAKSISLNPLVLWFHFQ